MRYFLISCYLLTLSIPTFAAEDTRPDTSLDNLLSHSSILPTIVPTAHELSYSQPIHVRSADDCPTTPETPDNSGETSTDNTDTTGDNTTTEPTGTDEPTIPTPEPPLSDEEIQDRINNLPQGSTRLSLNKEIEEILRSGSDMDFFKIYARSNGNLTITISTLESVVNSDLGWRVELYFQKNLDYALQATTLSESSSSVSFQQGISSGTYYLKVYSEKGGLAPAGKYFLKASLEENAFFEASINDSVINAAPILLGGRYSGNLSSTEDVDYYLFEMKNEDTVDIALKQNQPSNSSDNGWSLLLFSDDNLESPLHTFNLPTNLEFINTRIQLQPKNYYIQLASLSKETKPEGTYQFTVIPSHIDESTGVCPQILTYAKNPDTGRWAIFPTPCDAPSTWFSTQGQPIELSDNCETKTTSNTSRYFINEGVLSIPAVEAVDDNGCVVGVYQAQMQSVDLSSGKFDLMRVLSTHKDKQAK